MQLKDSPFVELGCPFTAYEAVKMLLLLPWVPLRLCLGGAALVAMAVINSAAAWGVPPDQPLPAWRRSVVLASKELVGVVLWAMGFRVRLAPGSRQQLAEALRLRAVGVFNHVSWADAFLLVWLMAPSGVSKADNARLPVIGTAIRAMQTVFIPYEKLSGRRRADGLGAAGSSSTDSLAGDSAASSGTPAGGGCSSSSGADDDATPSSSPAGLTGFVGAAAVAATGEAASRQPAASSVLQPRAAARSGAAAAAAPAAAPAGGSSSSSSKPGSAFIVQGNVTEVLLQRVRHPSYCRSGGYPMLVMAPEGTTANGRGLLRFRTGAFVLGRPVLPICIKYKFRGVNPAWTMGDARWTFLRVLCQWRNDVELELLPPLAPSEMELREPALFAARVRCAMAACLQVPLVGASHDDYLALRKLGLRGVSWDGRRLQAEPRSPLLQLLQLPLPLPPQQQQQQGHASTCQEQQGQHAQKEEEEEEEEDAGQQQQQEEEEQEGTERRRRRQGAVEEELPGPQHGLDGEEEGVVRRRPWCRQQQAPAAAGPGSAPPVARALRLEDLEMRDVMELASKLA